MGKMRGKYRGYVTFRMERVASIARAEASKLYKQECGLDIRALRVLRRVAEGPSATVSEIVEDTMFERTLVSRLISELVTAGLLQRRIAENDARQFNIDITKAGLAKVTTADEFGDRLNNDLLSCLNAEELEVFDRCLEKLVLWRPKSSPEPAPFAEAAEPAAHKIDLAGNGSQKSLSRGE